MLPQWNAGAAQMLAAFLAVHQTTAARTAAIEEALESEAGPQWREQFGEWITTILPAEAVVPPVYREWRPLVRDAMRFVVSRLSAARLAPKIVEQIELPPDTPAEQRLLRLIAKVPGLQKIGQVLARNRHLHRPLRRALAQLENGIRDASPREIRAILEEALGARLAAFDVRIEERMLSEASVSAVVRFTWRNPAGGRRERGVFKVLKPHIPGCFREDMAILHDLARHLAARHSDYGFSYGNLPETLTEIRLLLEHEVDFRREQATLRKAARAYARVPGVRVPRVIRPLCAPVVTAITEEPGVKITEASRRRPALRARAAEQLVEALVVVPAFARGDALFHADPHAGNLLYHARTSELVILDWALTEYLTREQRRQMVALMIALALRDPAAACHAIGRLCTDHYPAQDRIVRRQVLAYFAGMPLLGLPGTMDAMRLLDRIALQSVRFPAPLLMFRKALFTLDGVLKDLTGSELRIDAVVAGYLAAHWREALGTFWSLFSAADWLAFEWSAVTYGLRLGVCGALRWQGWGRLPAQS